MFGLFSSPEKLLASAQVQETKEKYQNALDLYYKSLAKFAKRPKIPDEVLRGFCYLGMGRCHDKLGHAREAKDNYLTALDHHAIDGQALRALKPHLDVSHQAVLPNLEKIIRLKPEANWPRFRWASTIIDARSPNKQRLSLAIKHLQDGSLQKEFYPFAALLLGRAHLYLQQFVDAKKYLHPLAAARAQDTEVAFYYAATLLGLNQCRESLAVLNPFIRDKKAAPNLLQLAAFCYYTVHAGEEALAILQDQYAKGLLTERGCQIFLELLLQRRNFKKANDVVKNLLQSVAEQSQLLAVQARVLELLGRFKPALEIYRALLNNKSQSLGLWAKVLSYTLDESSASDILANTQSFVECLVRTNWRLEEPLLEVTLGKEDYAKFCRDFLKKLLVFLWQHQSSRDAFECAYALYQLDRNNSLSLPDLLFLGGLNAWLNKKPSDIERFWRGCKESASSSPKTKFWNRRLDFCQRLDGNEHTLLQTAQDLLNNRDYVFLLSGLAWFGKPAWLEKIFAACRDDFSAYQNFKFIVELQKQDFSGAFQTLYRNGAGTDPGIQHVFISLSLFSNDRKNMQAALALSRRQMPGTVKVDKSAVLENRLLWALEKYDAILQNDTMTPDLSLLRCAAAIKLNKPNLAIHEIERLLHPASGGSAGTVICRILQTLDGNSSHGPGIDANQITRLAQKFFDTYKQPVLQQQFVQALLPLQQLPAIALVLRQRHHALLTDKNFLHRLGAAYHAHALICESAGQIQEAINAWRMVFACWAQLFTGADFFKTWALQGRAHAYSKEIGSTHINQAQNAIDSKLLQHFGELTQNLKGVKRKQFDATCRYLYYEFVREREFIQWLNAGKIQLAEFPGPFQFGPLMIRHLGLIENVFKVLKTRTAQQQRAVSFENLLFQALLGRVLGQNIPLPQTPQDKTFQDWREFFSTLGLARVLIKSGAYQKAADYLTNLYCDNEAVCKAAACRHDSALLASGLRVPCGACDTFQAANPKYSATELRTDAIRLAIQANLEMAFAGVTKVDRDFDVVGRYWENVLNLADGIKEREKYRGQIIETCLGIAQTYEKDRKYTVGIRFLDGCNKFLRDSRLLAQIAAMKNILAVAHSEKKQLTDAWKLISEVMECQIDSDLYFSNYANIAFMHVENLVQNDPESAQRIAQEAIQKIRAAQNVEQKLQGFTAQQLCEGLAQKFYNLAATKAGSDFDKALDLLGRGLQLGVREPYFLDMIRKTIRQEYGRRTANESPQSATAFLQILRANHSHDEKILKVISEIENTGAMESALQMIRAGDVMAGFARLLATLEFDIDFQQQAIMIEAVEKAYNAGMVREAMEMLADKCEALGHPPGLKNLCITGYAKFITQETGLNRLAEAGELFDDADLFFPDERSIVQAWQNARNRYAVKLTERGQYREALEFFKALCDEAPRQPTYKENLQRVYQIEINNLMRRGNLREAIQLTLEAQNSFPGLFGR